MLDCTSSSHCHWSPVKTAILYRYFVLQLSLKYCCSGDLAILYRYCVLRLLLEQLSVYKISHRDAKRKPYGSKKIPWKWGKKLSEKTWKSGKSYSSLDYCSAEVKAEIKERGRITVRAATKDRCVLGVSLDNCRGGVLLFKRRCIKSEQMRKFTPCQSYFSFSISHQVSSQRV